MANKKEDAYIIRVSNNYFVTEEGFNLDSDHILQMRIDSGG